MIAPKPLVTRFPEKKTKKPSSVYHSDAIDKAGFSREVDKLSRQIADLVASIGDFALLTSTNEDALDHYTVVTLHAKGLKTAFDQYQLITRELK